MQGRDPDYDTLDLGSLDDICPSASQKLVSVDWPMVAISGTEIRRRVAIGLSVRYQLPDGVERYMYRYGLYRDTEVSG